MIPSNSAKRLHLQQYKIAGINKKLSIINTLKMGDASVIVRKQLASHY
jgi:hypothetical protein